MRRLVLLLCLLAAPLWAVEPGEMLDVPALEERAREISSGLRCPVCQNESIDVSNADVSADLRRTVREELVRLALEEIALRVPEQEAIVARIEADLATPLLPLVPVFEEVLADLETAGVATGPLLAEVEEAFVARDANALVVDAIVEDYTEFVLLRPTARGANLLLWLAAPAMLLVALGVGWVTIRARSRGAVSEDLSDEEEKRLDEILRS